MGVSDVAVKRLRSYLVNRMGVSEAVLRNSVELGAVPSEYHGTQTYNLICNYIDLNKSIRITLPDISGGTELVDSVDTSVLSVLDKQYLIDTKIQDISVSLLAKRSLRSMVHIGDNPWNITVYIGEQPRVVDPITIMFAESKSVSRVIVDRDLHAGKSSHVRRLEEPYSKYTYAPIGSDYNEEDFCYIEDYYIHIMLYLARLAEIAKPIGNDVVAVCKAVSIAYDDPDYIMSVGSCSGIEAAVQSMIGKE